MVAIKKEEEEEESRAVMAEGGGRKITIIGEREGEDGGHEEGGGRGGEQSGHGCGRRKCTWLRGEANVHGGRRRERRRSGIGRGYKRRKGGYRDTEEEGTTMVEGRGCG